MTYREALELLMTLTISIKNVLLGGAGGVVAYMFDYSKSKKAIANVEWSNSAMLINMFIGAFVASSLAGFIPDDMNGRDGIVGFIGVSSYAILGIVESKFAKYILGKTIGMNADTCTDDKTSGDK